MDILVQFDNKDMMEFKRDMNHMMVFEKKDMMTVQVKCKKDMILVKVYRKDILEHLDVIKAVHVGYSAGSYDGFRESYEGYNNRTKERCSGDSKEPGIVGYDRYEEYDTVYVKEFLIWKMGMSIKSGFIRNLVTFA